MKSYLNKNKALLFLPMALLPFVILIFYVLGGGENAKKENRNNENRENQEGANYLLPEAEKSIEIFDKLEAYEQQGVIASPLWRDGLLVNDSMKIAGEGMLYPSDSIQNNESLFGQTYENLLAHIKQKEIEIKKELSGQQDENQRTNSETGYRKVTKRSLNTKSNSEKGDLETQYQSQPPPVFQTTGIEELDKVFDENIVLTRQNDSLLFGLERAEARLLLLEQKQNAGFTLEKRSVSGFKNEKVKNSLIKAEVYETTTVMDGNRVKLRLLEDVWINGIKLKKNTFIYGVCKIKNERLHIQITQLPVKGSFLPVDLMIYDLDGLPGLYVPDNVARKVMKDVGGSTNTSSLFGISNDPLTYAGIRAADRTAQTLLKRVRLKKVTIKKNTLVYLINQK